VVPAAAGCVELLGRPLAAFSARELARAVAVVPQETAVPFPFRVAEVALMGRAPHLPLLGFESRDDERRAREALERVGIADLAERSILEVSGGERQLAMVARALVQETPVVLLDEPTAHLDVARRLDLLGLVRGLAAEGRAVLVVSHDLGLSARFADRIALLGDGRVLAAGPAAETLAPELLRRAFGVEAEVLVTSDGAPVIVPRRAAPAPGGAGAERERGRGGG
jgi:iron complex transport system ATP-binding protein